MLKRVPIALAQVKVGNTSNNIMNSIKLQNRMDTIFMNSKNNKTSDPQRLLLNLTDKINSKRSDKYVALSNLSITIHGKI